MDARSAVGRDPPSCHAPPHLQEFSTIVSAFLTMWANQSGLLDLDLMRSSHNPVRADGREAERRGSARCRHHSAPDGGRLPTLN